jgi:DNA-binding transcriptional ArsR family regulator
MVPVARIPADEDPFAAIGDPTRRRILDLLAGGERPVKDLVAACSISQPSVSEHLRILRAVGLVATREAGRMRLYRLVPERMKEIADWVATYSRFWEKRLDGLRAYLDRPVE